MIPYLTFCVWLNFVRHRNEFQKSITHALFKWLPNTKKCCNIFNIFFEETFIFMCRLPFLFWSQPSYQTFFLRFSLISLNICNILKQNVLCAWANLNSEQQNVSIFFSIGLGHYIKQIQYFFILKALKLNSKNLRMSKNKVL